MGFSMALGLFLAAIGLSGILVAWLHSAPHETRLVKVLTWPRKAQDRIGISLASAMFIAIGALFAIDIPEHGLISITVCIIVIAAIALALGLREPAV